MEFNAEELTLENLNEIANFIKLLTTSGLNGAYPETIGYDVYRDDAPYCIDSNNALWTLDNNGKLFCKYEF